MNPRRGGRVTVAVAAAAAADGGEGTTSSTVREHLWISALVESLTSYHHRITAELRGVQEGVESNGNSTTARNEDTVKEAKI